MQFGWYSIHYASKRGHLQVIKLLLDLGTLPSVKTTDGNSPLTIAASARQTDVVLFLLNLQRDNNNNNSEEQQDSMNELMNDKKFLFDLMICGKTTTNHSTPTGHEGNGGGGGGVVGGFGVGVGVGGGGGGGGGQQQNVAIREFILSSPSPLETASVLANHYRQLRQQHLELSQDFETASKLCEKMTTKLMAIASIYSSPTSVLQSLDSHSTPFIDVLLRDNLKSVAADSAVQRYLTSVWEGHVESTVVVRGKWYIFLLFLCLFTLPPIAQLYWATPFFGKTYHKVPIIKFMCRITSHLHFIIILCSVAVVPTPALTERQSLMPTWNELLLLAWLGGMTVSELTNPSPGFVNRLIKVSIIGLSAIAVGLHSIALFLQELVFC